MPSFLTLLRSVFHEVFCRRTGDPLPEAEWSSEQRRTSALLGELPRVPPLGLRLEVLFEQA